jgi:hypothetical protein
MMKTKLILYWICLATLAWSLTGCLSHHPSIPHALSDSGVLGRYSTNRFEVDYAKYSALMDAGKTNEALPLRDRMIDAIRIEIEMQYRTFEQDFYKGRAEINWAADIVELGLSAATAAVGGESTKAALGAILTGFKGTRLSAEKNFFREKTTEVVVSAMQAERSKKLALILQKMELGVDRYPFEDAAVDLVEFFYAGTVEGALQNLTIETGQKAVVEKEALRKVQKERISVVKPTEDEMKMADKIQVRIKELRDSTDTAAAQAAAQSILKKLNVNVPDGQAISQLTTEHRKTLTDRPYLKKLHDAFFVP